MAWLDMSKMEFEYWLESYSEAFYMRGQDAQLYQAKTVQKDEYLDLNVDYEDAVDIGVMFVDNPKPILKANNWIIEDADLPYVCYMVTKDRHMDNVEIVQDMRVVIPSTYGVVTARQFIVTNVRGISIDPLLWLCSLAPCRVRKSIEKPSSTQKESELYKTDLGRGYIKNDKD